MKVLVLVVFAACLFGSLSAKVLPSSFPRCFREDPNLNQCLLKSTEKWRQFVKTGIRSFNFPPVDPFVVSLIIMEQDTEHLSYKTVVRNLTVTGLKNYKFEEFKYDPKTMHLEYKAKAGPLFTTADCTFDGIIMGAGMKGHGTILLTQDSINFAVQIDGEIVDKNGVDYYRVKGINVDVKVVGGMVRFENFEGPNTIIVNAINELIKQNYQTLVDVFLANYQGFFNSIAKSQLQIWARQVPYDELLPNSISADK